MNDVRTRDEIDALDLEAGRPIDRKTQNAPKLRLRARRRWGGHLVRHSDNGSCHLEHLKQILRKPVVPP